MWVRVVLIGILVLMIARGFWVLLDNVIAGAGGRPARPKQPAVKLARDPVCGMHVAPATAVSLSDGATTHYFCSNACRDRFRRSA